MKWTATDIVTCVVVTLNALIFAFMVSEIYLGVGWLGRFINAVQLHGQ